MFVCSFRQADQSSVKRVVISTVFKFFFDPLAYFEVVIARDRHVATIKEFVNIRAK